MFVFLTSDQALVEVELLLRQDEDFFVTREIGANSENRSELERNLEHIYTHVEKLEFIYKGSSYEFSSFTTLWAFQWLQIHHLLRFTRRLKNHAYALYRRRQSLATRLLGR